MSFAPDTRSPASPNEKYFEHVDWVVQQAAERGLQMWLVPTWSRFTSSGESLAQLCTYCCLTLGRVDIRADPVQRGQRTILWRVRRPAIPLLAQDPGR